MAWLGPREHQGLHPLLWRLAVPLGGGRLTRIPLPR